MPTVQKIRAYAKRTVCQSNLRQIVLAWQMYFNDYDGRFYQGLNAHYLFGGWMARYEDSNRPLNPYLSLPLIPETEDSAKVFKCTADKSTGVAEYQSSIYVWSGNSYKTNILLVGQTQMGASSKFPDGELKDKINARLDGLRLSKTSRPSELIFVGDHGGALQWLTGYSQQVSWHKKEDHHNMAFLDGHVGFIWVRKGLFITEDYCAIPFKDLYKLTREVQVEIPRE